MGAFDRPKSSGRRAARLRRDGITAHASYRFNILTTRGQIREYWPPTPYVTFYEAMPDKRGEVWAGELHGGRMLRFNPQADRWTEYVLPEPYSHDRRTWIDESTTPVTVWYVDHNSYLVRVQARE